MAPGGAGRGPVGRAGGSGAPQAAGPRTPGPQLPAPFAWTRSAAVPGGGRRDGAGSRDWLSSKYSIVGLAKEDGYLI